MKIFLRNSTYSTRFINPVVDREKLRLLENEGKFKEMAFAPVKAAPNDFTSSVFHDDTVKKFTNMVVKGGDKVTARTLIEKTFEIVKRTQLAKYNAAIDAKKSNIECNPYKIFHQAVGNCKPIAELTPTKRGAVTYQVPVPISPRRSNFLGMKWLILAARDKEQKVHFPEQLAKELLDAAKNQGKVVRKKQDLHIQCEANKAYAHFRW